MEYTVRVPRAGREQTVYDCGVDCGRPSVFPCMDEDVSRAFSALDAHHCACTENSRSGMSSNGRSDEVVPLPEPRTLARHEVTSVDVYRLATMVTGSASRCFWKDRDSQIKADILVQQANTFHVLMK